MKLIDKDAVLAEIENRIEEYKDMKIDSSYYEGMVASLEFFRDEFINTLEVKEVDLEKESLTWEDIPELLSISEQLKTSWWFRDRTKEIGTQVFWEEVLKRFKERKKL
jgi:hypothetical protein